MLFAATLVLLVASSWAQQKKGGLDAAKTASDCFLQFSKIPRQNCGGGLIETCADCSIERCAEKCYFEHSKCQGYSYSNTSTPKCVLKDIGSCEKEADNWYGDSDYTFFTRVPTCNLLPSGGLFPSANGCAFAQNAHRCNDMLEECNSASCLTEQGCQDTCLSDDKCHGALYEPTTPYCSLWYGRNCTGIRAEYSVQYFEKYCGAKLEEFEKKRLDEYKRKCAPKCPNIPLPPQALTNSGSTEIGEVATIFCLRNFVLQGPRQIICVQNLDDTEWMPYGLENQQHDVNELKCVYDTGDMASNVPFIKKQD